MSKYLSIFSLVIIQPALIIYTQKILNPIHFVPQNIFFFDLLGKSFYIPPEFLIFISMGNLLLLWLIGKKTLKRNLSFLPPLIYTISPWGIYLTVAGSFYIYLTFLLLLAAYSLLLIKSADKFWGPILLVSASAVSLYSSSFMILLLPLIFFLLIILKLIPFTTLKSMLIILFILTFPLLFFIYSNPPSFKNIFNNQVQIFSDPGLLNNVNAFQGAAREENFGSFAKLSENKYIFFSEYIFIKFIKQVVPSTFFTPQEKLLNFSFSPPIYLGFLIPFFFAVYQILKPSLLRKMVFIILLLTSASVVSKQAVDLNRLFLIAPFLMLIISYGFEELFKISSKKRLASFFLILSAFLVIFQFLITLSDLSVKEKNRFTQYFETNYEIGKQ